MTPEEVERFDKRKAAEHEAGHLTVMLALGRRGEAWLVRTNTNDDWEEKTWVGKSTSWGGRHPAIGVAGVIAESLDQSTDAHELADWIDQEILSPSQTDWTHFESRDWEAVLTATEQAGTLLLEHREFLDWATASLIEHERITDLKAWLRFYDPAAGVVGRAAAGAAADSLVGPDRAAIGAVVGGVAGANAKNIAKRIPKAATKPAKRVSNSKQSVAAMKRKPRKSSAKKAAKKKSSKKSSAKRRKIS